MKRGKKRMDRGWNKIGIVLLAGGWVVWRGYTVRYARIITPGGVAEADGSAGIRGTRGRGEHRVEFGTRRQFNRYSDTSRFVVVAEAAGASRGPAYVYKAEVSGKRGGGGERREGEREDEGRLVVRGEPESDRRTKSGEAERRRNPFSLLYSYSEPRDVANPPSATTSAYCPLCSPLSPFLPSSLSAVPPRLDSVERYRYSGIKISIKS